MTRSAAKTNVQMDDATIRAAVKCASIPSLMLALVHLTGDMELIRGEIRPQKPTLGNPFDGITPEQQAQVQEKAFEVISRYRDNPTPFTVPTEADIQEMLEFLTSENISSDYVEFLRSELSLEGENPFAQPAILDLPKADIAGFKVVIIGAGMSGVLSAVRLKEAGIEFEVIEKNPDVGGTWFENTYPGCRVDSSNHVYSYSFRPNDWPQHFSNQPTLQRYFADTADDYHLRDHIRFCTEVTEARFNETTNLWEITTSGTTGVETLTANAIISAVGQLNQPRIPDIQGREQFKGASFHSARWQHDVNLTGKRIGVIGTGASAFQFVPIISQQAQSVTIFQRNAPWVVPQPDYFQEVLDGKHWLLNNVPFYAKWFRFNLFWRQADSGLVNAQVDETWQRPERSVSKANEQFREALMANLTNELKHDPELLSMCTPDYPPGAKRVLIDDGTWLKALQRENVSLTTDPILEITETGLRTEGGAMHEFDVLILATGFRASDFLQPMKIYGAGGRELHDSWQGEPRAYKGISIPGFPNLFCCYGPNTNIVVNGSIVFFSECSVRYILGCLATLMDKGAASMDVKRDVHDRYNERIDAGNRAMAWGHSSVNSWYKNASGRITQNWPFTLLAFWQQTRKANESDYTFR